MGVVLKHYHHWSFLEPTQEREDFMRLAGLIGEREGGLRTFESTPNNPPNPWLARHLQGGIHLSLVHGDNDR